MPVSPTRPLEYYQLALSDEVRSCVFLAPADDNAEQVDTSAAGNFAAAAVAVEKFNRTALHRYMPRYLAGRGENQGADHTAAQQVAKHYAGARRRTGAAVDYGEIVAKMVELIETP